MYKDVETTSVVETSVDAEPDAVTVTVTVSVDGTHASAVDAATDSAATVAVAPAA